jgi:predicted hydrocarbon binding protein
VETIILAGCIEGIFNVIVSCEKTKCEAMDDEYYEFRVELA